ncbi:MAG: hypothetical protein J0H15_01295 [Xanthomonadales bacterium]|nr:hypothetical protein [Xanthomonadales bacterium]
MARRAACGGDLCLQTTEEPVSADSQSTLFDWTRSHRVNLVSPKVRSACGNLIALDQADALVEQNCPLRHARYRLKKECALCILRVVCGDSGFEHVIAEGDERAIDGVRRDRSLHACFVLWVYRDSKRVCAVCDKLDVVVLDQQPVNVSGRNDGLFGLVERGLEIKVANRHVPHVVDP